MIIYSRFVICACGFDEAGTESNSKLKCQIANLEGLGFATQDHSWCAFIGDFKITVLHAASLRWTARLVNNYVNLRIWSWLGQAREYWGL
jgi:hypothetical protein